MTTDYDGKVVYEDSDSYIVLVADRSSLGGFRKVQYYKNNTTNYTQPDASVTQSYELPTFRSTEVQLAPYFTGGGGEFSGGGASASYESSSSDSSSDSSSSSSD